MLACLLLCGLLVHKAFAEELEISSSASAKQGISYEFLPIPLYTEEFGFNYGVAVKANNVFGDKDFFLVGKVFAENDGQFVAYQYPFSPRMKIDAGFVQVADYTKHMNLARGQLDRKGYKYKGTADIPFFQLSYLNTEKSLEAKTQVALPTIGFSKFLNMQNEELSLPNLQFSDYSFLLHSYSLFYHRLDDVQKPLEGFSLGYQLAALQAASAANSSFLTHSFTLRGYVNPVDRLFLRAQAVRSQASLTKESSYNNIERVGEALDVDCSGLASGQKQECEDFTSSLAEFIAQQNAKGNARGLGGPGVLRAYSLDELRGKFTQSLSLEAAFRFSLDKYPLELVAFQEYGQASDVQSQLGDTTFESTGLGVRLDLAENLTARLDYAEGDDGKSAWYFVFGRAF